MQYLTELLDLPDHYFLPVAFSFLAPAMQALHSSVPASLLGPGGSLCTSVNIVPGPQGSLRISLLMLYLGGPVHTPEAGPPSPARDFLVCVSCSVLFLSRRTALSSTFYTLGAPRDSRDGFCFFLRGEDKLSHLITEHFQILCRFKNRLFV